MKAISWAILMISLLFCDRSIDYRPSKRCGCAIADVDRCDVGRGPIGRGRAAGAESGWNGDTPATRLTAMHGADVVGSPLSGMWDDDFMVALRSRAIRSQYASQPRRGHARSDHLHRSGGVCDARHFGHDAAIRLVGCGGLDNDFDTRDRGSRLGLAIGLATPSAFPG